MDTLTVTRDTIIVAYPPLDGALAAWADATTDATSDRRRDLLRDKTRALSDFFAWVCKPIDEVKPADVKQWQREIEGRGLSPATVYAMISRVSSFYDWMLQDPELAAWVRSNPVRLARPKAPKAYQAESTKALDDDQVRELVRIVRARADSGDVRGKRDYALLLFYLLTGMRRAEVARLRWGDVKINGCLVVTTRVKGGEHITREVSEPMVKDALLDYLRTAGRLDTMTAGSPIWTRHDRAGQPGEAVSSHAVATAFKGHAEKTGIPAFHLHQLRHTYARIVADEAGSLTETQEALGHRNLATTRVYVQRLGVKRDRFSGKVAARVFA